MARKQWIPWMAYRYWRSKKSFSIINIISGISFWGIAVGTAALIIVLSAFNGLEEMVSGMFNNFHSDIRIEPVSGKYFDNTRIDSSKIASLGNVKNMSFVVEDICMVRYGDQQQVAYLKGVEPNRGFEEKMDPLMLVGSSSLTADSISYAIPGVAIFQKLGINLNDYSTPITFYSPKRTAEASSDLSSSFRSVSAIPGGAFSVQQEFDEKYVIVPIGVARDLFEYNGISTAMEVNVKDIESLQETEDELQTLVGDQFTVKNRMEQEEAIYKTMKTERLVVFLILALILLVTSFTLISTLTLIILSKQKDLSTLFALGAGVRQIRRIIVSHGFIISMVGMLVGFAASATILFLHLQFGLVTFEGGQTFATSIYPVKLIWTDFAYVFATVFGITILVSRIPVMRIHSSWFSFRY